MSTPVTNSGADPDLFRIAFFVPAEFLDVVTAYLFNNAPCGWQETEAADGVYFEVYFQQESLASVFVKQLVLAWSFLSVECDRIADRDWTYAWREFFTPVTVSDRFIILAPWLEPDYAGDLTPIIIEPEMAFGTGHHATTVLCLQAVSELLTAGKLLPDHGFLDLGTGSGILGIACCKAGLKGTGLDIDPLAVANACKNRNINAVESSFEILTGSLSILDCDTNFDLIIANILAGPLKDMANNILSLLKPGGYLVLSGILQEQVAAVSSCYMSLGLPKPVCLESKPWAALVWHIPPGC